MRKKPTHKVLRVIGGSFRTACGIYLFDSDKVNGSAYRRDVTCKNCLRSRRT